MKIIYIILVMILVSCASPKRTTILATEIEIKANGQSSVVNIYSDSTATITNLTSEGELVDSTTIK